MEHVIGVDVSKHRLEAYDLATGRRLEVANDAAGIARLAAWAGPGALVVMEASGGYERLAHRRLLEHGLAVAIVNPKRVRDFARASGRLAKTDRVDAEMIARYGAFARPPTTPLPDAAGRELAELLAFRERLLGEITARTQQLSHLETPLLRRRAQADLARLRRDKAEIETLLRRVIDRAPGLARGFALLTSMPGGRPDPGRHPAGPAARARRPRPAPDRQPGRRGADRPGQRAAARPAQRRRGAQRRAPRALHGGRQRQPRQLALRRLLTAAWSPGVSPPSSPSSPPCARCSSPSTPSPAPSNPGPRPPSNQPHDPQHTTVAKKSPDNKGLAFRSLPVGRGGAREARQRRRPSRTTLTSIRRGA